MSLYCWQQVNLGRSFSLGRQSGSVLVITLIFLIFLTGIGVSLVNSSSFDVKLAGAGQLKSESRQASLGAVDEVVYDATRRALPQGGDLANMAPAAATINSPLTITTDVPGTAVGLVILQDETTNLPLTTCPRAEPAWEAGVVLCASARVVADHRFDNSEDLPRTQAEALAYQRYLNPNQN
jgi:hypothetical protein